MLQVGSLNTRVKLQSQVRTADGMGGQTVTWKDEATVWAAVWPTVGNEALKSGQLQFEVTHRVRIRNREDIRASWRINHYGKYYTIRSILEPDEEVMDLLCKETET